MSLPVVSVLTVAARPVNGSSAVLATPAGSLLLAGSQLAGVLTGAGAAAA